jgi:translation initiation factor IF-3
VNFLKQNYKIWRNPHIKDLILNNSIRENQVRLISSTGEQLGVVSLKDALMKAKQEGLDLAEISPTMNPPVCKIMDYGKFKFEQTKREKEQRKKQKVVEIKEVQLSFTIEKHDIEVKAKAASSFLTEGNKVKITIRMFGRQQANPEMGIAVMNSFAKSLEGVSVIDKPAEVLGRNIFMILSPKE